MVIQMKRLLIVLFMGIFMCSIVSAQDIDSVILTTTENYPDSFVAAVAANRIGAALLLTDRDEIPEDTLEQLDELDPSTVYIIGGTSVISSNVEDYLKEQGYGVIRIAGITRYGTSTEVAEYFWADGSGKVVMVWDKTGTPDGGNEKMLVLAKDLAQLNDAPLIISGIDVLPAATEETLQNLDVEEVILIGDFSDDVGMAIRELGIETEDIQGDMDRIRDRIRNQTRDMDRNETPLVIIAVGNWKDMMNAPFQPGSGVSRLISNEGDIQDVIDEIVEDGYTRIRVVGKPELAQEICDSLDAEGIEHDCLTGNASKVAAQIMKQEREMLKELRQKFEEKRLRIQERLQERIQEMNNECGEFFDLANATLSDVEDDLGDVQQYKERLQEMVQVRQECMNSIASGNLTRARERIQQLKSDAKVFRWDLKNLIGDEIEDELDIETRGKSEVADRIQEKIQEVKRIRDEIQETDENIAERCTEMIQQMEELENEGRYSEIHSKIKVALQGCVSAQEESRGDGNKTTTTTVRGKQGTTTTTIIEGVVTTTTIKGHGRG
jgi:putative cell wall-binding protein